MVSNEDYVAVPVSVITDLTESLTKVHKYIGWCLEVLKAANKIDIENVEPEPDNVNGEVSNGVPESVSHWKPIRTRRPVRKSLAKRNSFDPNTLVLPKIKINEVKNMRKSLFARSSKSVGDVEVEETDADSSPMTLAKKRKLYTPI